MHTGTIIHTLTYHTTIAAEHFHKLQHTTTSKYRALPCTEQFELSQAPAQGSIKAVEMHYSHFVARAATVKGEVTQQLVRC